VIVKVLTVSGDAVETTLPDRAVMFVLPTATPVASPLALMVATFVCEDCQVTVEVTSPVVLLPKVAVAEYCFVPPGAIWAPVGETLIEMMVSAEGKKPPPQLAMEKITMPQAATRPNQFNFLSLYIVKVPFPKAQRCERMNPRENILSRSLLAVNADNVSYYSAARPTANAEAGESACSPNAGKAFLFNNFAPENRNPDGAASPSGCVIRH
jgi:hypothetical protein